MTYREFLPDSRLRALVRVYWQIEEHHDLATQEHMLGYFVLHESRQQRAGRFDSAHLNPFAQLSGALAYPEVRRLVTVNVLFILPFSLMGVGLPLLRDSLGWGPGETSTVYMVVGVCDILAQGFLLPHLIRWLGERGVAQLGLGMGIVGLIGYVLLPPFTRWLP